ncbi:MAG TPA: DUF2252 domain-containing protein [Edaphobacter sp.]
MAKLRPKPSVLSVVKRETTYKERYAEGKALRDKCPRQSHAAWKPAKGRRDPVEMVLASEQGRIPKLLPLRHGRMVRSAFTFYRGSALAMAADLATTPSTNVRVQCCGDAHLCNFGGYATPERKIIFSVNDLDETLPAPWEWDIKRLAASFVVACRDNQVSDSAGKDIAATCVRSYRESMAEFSQMKTLELWYYAMGPETLAGMDDPNIRKRVQKRVAQEQAKSRGEELFPKLVDHMGEIPLIKDTLPTIFHDELNPPGTVSEILESSFRGYRDTLPYSYQSLLDRYTIYDAAVKVVGIGSVGTSCWVLLLMTREDDPLFLQVKEARPSVLEPYAGASVCSNHGQRVVNGYRMMQSASDMFLGWTRGKTRDFFVRQLRDVKIAPRVETFGKYEFGLFAQWCGKALALCHARSGTPSVLSGYMGNSDTFDRAIADFSVKYADQNEQDHAALKNVVRSGKVPAEFEEDR